MTVRDVLAGALDALAPDERRLVVAVSGGADSLALLLLLAEARQRAGLALLVGHVHHGLQPSAGEATALVVAAAERLGVPHRIGYLALPAGTGETTARVARYRWLAQLRREAGASLVVTAHHADDQAETVLQRVLRGSAPAGLAAMRPRRGRRWRPLLEVRRAALEAVCRAAGQPWWTDPANADPRHDRSWLRHEVLPRLARRGRDVTTALGQVAAHAADDMAAWDAVLEALPGLAPRTEPAGRWSVAVPALERAPAPLARALLRALARRAGVVLGPRRAEVLQEALPGLRSGATIPLGGASYAEVAFGRVLLGRRRLSGAAPAELRPANRVLEWGGWRVRVGAEAAPARQARRGAVAWFAPGPLVVRPWQPGDRVAPLAGRGSRLVVKCLQEARIPASARRGWPVVESAGRLVWVPGVVRSNLLLPEVGEEAIRVDIDGRAG